MVKMFAMVQLCGSIHVGIPLCNPSKGEQTGSSIALRVMACVLGALATAAGIAILVGAPFLAATPVGVAYALMAGGPLLVILSLCLSSIRAPHDLHRRGKSNSGSNKMQIAVFKETKEVCEAAVAGDSSPVDCTTMLQDTMVYQPSRPAIQQGQERYKTEFLVVKDDTLNVLSSYADNNPVALNMANRQTPGGGVAYGATAQEEELCRRTTLYTALKRHAEDKEYPIPDMGGIYTPAVQIFKKDAAENYATMDGPFQEVAIVSVAGYNLSSREDNAALGFKGRKVPTATKLRSNATYMNNTKDKIRNMLRIVHAKGHTTLVLGALGCGVFGNPPEVVAECFKEVFEESEFAGCFATVVFAILVKNEHDQANFDAFSDVIFSA